MPDYAFREVAVDSKTLADPIDMQTEFIIELSAADEIAKPAPAPDVKPANAKRKKGGRVMDLNARNSRIAASIEKRVDDEMLKEFHEECDKIESGILELKRTESLQLAFEKQAEFAEKLRGQIDRYAQQAAEEKAGTQELLDSLDSWKWHVKHLIIVLEIISPQGDEITHLYEFLPDLAKKYYGEIYRP